jgi:teichuronic acid biosynthesis glycosyltransferase TuaC
MPFDNSTTTDTDMLSPERMRGTSFRHFRIICVTTNYPTTYTPFAGTFVRNTVQALRQLGVPVAVVSPVGIGMVLKHLLKPMRHTVTSDGEAPVVLALPTRWPRTRRLFAAWNERRLAGAIVNSSVVNTVNDRVVVYAHFVASARAALRAMPGTPIIAVVGESSPWEYDESFGMDWPKTLLGCAAVVAVSQALHEYLRSRCPELGERLHLIANGVDTDQFRPQSREACRRALGLALDDRIVLFVGGLIERKGPHRVLAAARMVGAKCAFLGSGHQRPEGEDVLTVGAASPDMVRQWMGAADCFVLPSLSEGRSNAVLEALASGLPVVVSDRPFNREFVTEHCGAFVEPLSESSIAEGIRRALDPDAAGAMRIAARAVAESLSMAARAQMLQSLFASVAQTAYGDLPGARVPDR